MFPLNPEQAVYKSYVIQTILYGSEVWSMKGNKIRIWQRPEISVVRAMCGVQVKDRTDQKTFC